MRISQVLLLKNYLKGPNNTNQDSYIIHFLETQCYLKSLVGITQFVSVYFRGSRIQVIRDHTSMTVVSPDP